MIDLTVLVLVVLGVALITLEFAGRWRRHRSRLYVYPIDDRAYWAARRYGIDVADYGGEYDPVRGLVVFVDRDDYERYRVAMKGLWDGD